MQVGLFNKPVYFTRTELRQIYNTVWLLTTLTYCIIVQ